MVVIGGGIAGLHASVSLLRRRNVLVTIVEPTAHHQFLTRLAAVAAGTQPTADAAQPLSAMVPTASVEQRRAVRIDESKRCVTVSLDDASELEADSVIIAAGAEPSSPPIRGKANAYALRTAADALAIRAVLDQCNPDRARGLVVVGAGATGCQLAAAAAIQHPELAITLIDRADRALPGFRNSLSQRAESILASRGIDLRFGENIERITKRGAVLSPTEAHPATDRIEGTVVWAGGFQAHGDAFGLETRDGRLVIDEFGQVAQSHRVFAAGDIAAHLDRRGDLRPMSAQIAAQAGQAVGANVAATLSDDAMTPLRLSDLGWVVDLGGGQGVADVLGLPLADPITDRLVPLLHTAIDYRNLFQIGGVAFMRRFGPGNAEVPSASELARDLGSFGLERD